MATALICQQPQKSISAVENGNSGLCQGQTIMVCVARLQKLAEIRRVGCEQILCYPALGAVPGAQAAEPRPAIKLNGVLCKCQAAAVCLQVPSQRRQLTTNLQI